MVFLPDGKLAVAGSRPGQEGDVRIYNLDAGKAIDFGGVPAVDGANDPTVLIKGLVQTHDGVLALALNPHGKEIASDRCVGPVPGSDPPLRRRADATLKNPA